MSFRVAIFVRDWCEPGGIESVAREQLRIFADHGCACSTFGHSGSEHDVPIQGLARRTALKNFLGEFKPDFCILHGVTHPGIDDDKVVLDELGIKSIGVCHFSFPSAILLGGNERTNSHFHRDAQKVTCVATVSAIDALWWRALGCRAFHVQDPFAHPAKSLGTIRRDGVDGAVNLLWVGRLCEQKQPTSALAAFAKVSQVCPNARLTMVGGDNAGIRTLEKYASRLRILDKVEFVPARLDISEYWARADIHLLSSVTESFCLVLAEAKSAGVPSVMFDIPFLELVKDRKGLISVPQGDIDGMANALVELVKDPERRLQLGVEAKKSLEDFTDEAVWQSWERVFAALSTGKGGYDVPSDVKNIVQQQFFAWNRFCDKYLWIVEMERNWQLLTHTSLRLFAKMLGSIVHAIRSVKRRIRG